MVPKPNAHYAVQVDGSGPVKVCSVSAQGNGALATFTPCALGSSEEPVGSGWRWNPGSGIYKENPATGTTLEMTSVSHSSGSMDFTFSRSGGASSLNEDLVLVP